MLCEHHVSKIGTYCFHFTGWKTEDERTGQTTNPFKRWRLAMTLHYVNKTFGSGQAEGAATFSVPFLVEFLLRIPFMPTQRFLQQWLGAESVCPLCSEKQPGRPGGGTVAITQVSFRAVVTHFLHQCQKRSQWWHWGNKQLRAVAGEWSKEDHSPPAPACLFAEAAGMMGRMALQSGFVLGNTPVRLGDLQP